MLFAFLATVAWRFQEMRGTVRWLNRMQATYHWAHDSQAPGEAALRATQSALAAVVGPELVSAVTIAEINAPEADDDLLQPIGALQHLEVLRLQSDRCSDTTLSRIQKLEELRELSLACPQMSFPGLLELRNLSKLRMLKLRATVLSYGELAVLSAALPSVDLDYNESSSGACLVRRTAARFPLLSRVKQNDMLFESLFPAQSQGGLALGPASPDVSVEHDDSKQRTGLVEQHASDEEPALRNSGHT